jgi:redox-sensitive bicupin YhaK (pirin superfamily)
MRSIELVKNAVPTLEGAGVNLHRAFGYYDKPRFDPFLMLDDFRNDDPDDYIAGFPWHPHRGIETITYMLEGSAEHGDSLGNRGVIKKGEVQWMTAGSGIIHMEMPKGDKAGRMYGFQLWANLPAAHKMTPPRYRDLRADAMPVVDAGNGVRVKLICGSLMGVSAPVNDIIIEPQYWDVSIPAGIRSVLPAPKGHTCFIYAYEGTAVIDGKEVQNRQVVLFGDGDEISVSAGNQDFKMLFLCAKPLGEPIAWRGPIVMNTREEIQTAFQELDNNIFIRVR